MNEKDTFQRQQPTSSLEVTRMQTPNYGFFRLPQIIGDAIAKPPIPAIIPVSRSTWLAGIKKGIYPKPVKLSTRCAAWRVQDIEELVKRLGNTEQPKQEPPPAKTAFNW